MHSKIYLVRHGQSMANIKIDDGGYDSPLTLVGREQVKKVILDVDLIICSPMRRTLETFYYSKITGKDVVVDHDFRERQCEQADLLLIKYMPDGSISLFEGLGEESEELFRERIIRVSEKLYEYSLTYKNIAVICHGCVIRELTGEKLDNAEIIEITQKQLIDIINRQTVILPSCCSYF